MSLNAKSVGSIEIVMQRKEERSKANYYVIDSILGKQIISQQCFKTIF